MFFDLPNMLIDSIHSMFASLVLAALAVTVDHKVATVFEMVAFPRPMFLMVRTTTL